MTEVGLRVEFRPPAWDVITTAMREAGDFETGGILIGPDRRGGSILVTHATGPGPDAKRGKAHFERDTKWCEEQLRELQKRLPVEWIGDWHTHVGGDVSLSAGDIGTASGFLEDDGLSFNRFVLLVLANNNDDLRIGIYVLKGRPEEGSPSSPRPETQ